MSAAAAPHQNAILFARGTLARLALWPTLRLAVHASWGGPASAEKHRWLAGVLVDQFEPFLVPPVPPGTTATAATSPPDDVYIEDLLLQIMADEFDVVLEDGSAAAVAKDVVRLFATICSGDGTFVDDLEAQAERVKGEMPKYEMDVGSGSDGEWEDDESEEESVPQLLDHSEPRTREPQVDEDGFIMVKKKGRR